MLSWEHLHQTTPLYPLLNQIKLGISGAKNTGYNLHMSRYITDFFKQWMHVLFHVPFTVLIFDSVSMMRPSSDRLGIMV